MPELSNFINELATLAGVEADNEQLKLLLADERLQNFEIHEDITKKVNNSLMTLDSAKNNKEVNDAFMGKFYGSIDVSSKRALKELGLPEDKINEIGKVTDTPKMIELALKEISDHAKSQVPASDGGDEELIKKNKELATQVNELTTKINEFPSVLEKKESELTQSFETKEISYKLGSLVSPYKYAEAYPLDFITFQVNNKLNESDFVINKEMKLMQKSNSELIAQKDNKEYTLTNFIEETISPYLVKSNGSNGSTNEPTKVPPSDSPLKNNQTGAHIQDNKNLQFSNENKPTTKKMSPQSA